MSRARRTARWAALGVLVLGSLAVAYAFLLGLAQAAPDAGASRFLLTLLTLAIVLLALGFVGILIRNLVRLIIDRKRGILGAKLRTKLVFFFLALVLLPAVILVIGAASFMKATVDSLLRTPVEGVVREAGELIKESGRQAESRSVRMAEALAEEIRGAPESVRSDPDRLRWVVRRRLRIDGLQVALWRPAEGVPVEIVEGTGSTAGPLRDRMLAASRELAAQATRSGTALFRVDDLGSRHLVQGGVPYRAGGTDRVVGAVVVGTLVSEDLSSRLDRLSQAESAYVRFRSERREVLRLYYSIIVLVGLATVFVASWIGFYLSRRITVPLQEMAAASREISAGNLGVRVTAASGDEVGMLVEAFNEMAAQLQESREVITRSTADLRRSNQALDERRRYIETLVANLSTAILSIDRDGMVTTANPAVGTLLGLRVQAGDDVRAVLDTPGLAPLVETVEEAAALGGDLSRRELNLTVRGRRTVVAAQVAHLRDAHGGDLGTLIMVEDLSDLLRAQKLAAWREVARRIAHEIKNPLTPIQLAAQRLRKKFAEGAPDLGRVVADCTASVEQEVGALKRLVDEFSHFARLPEPSPETVRFADVVEAAVNLFRGLPGIRWEVETDPGVGTVRVDPEQMRRVLINLIDNAVTAMNGSGHIRIRVGSASSPGSLRVEIEDDGPGIPAEQRSRIFDPYFSTKARGSGLGLAIVHRIVVDHRGEIRVEDAPEGGARFVIEVPADPTGATARRAG